MHPMTPVPYRVCSRRPDRADTVSLTLRPVEGVCPPFLPGQFTMVYAPGVGEIPISISGRARSGGYVQTIRAVGAVSGALCRRRPGDVVGVRGPYGTAWDVPAAKGSDVVVAAGGLGLAALRPVIRELAAHISGYGRVSVIVGTRTPATLIYPGELARWRDRHGIDVKITVDHPDRAWKGPVGLVTRLTGPRWSRMCWPASAPRSSPSSSPPDGCASNSGYPVSCSAVESPSGRGRTPRKRVMGQPIRGFKSHLHRHYKSP